MEGERERKRNKKNLIKFRSEILGPPLNFDWGMCNWSRRVYAVNGIAPGSKTRGKFEFDYSNFPLSFTKSDGPKFRTPSEIFI
jgi:hypothetical protein